MRRRGWRWARLWAAPAAGLLLANGCLVNAQRNLDFLLSPDALDNAARLPYSAVWPLMEALLKVSLFRA